MYPGALATVTPFAPGTLRAVGIIGIAAVGALLALRPRLGDEITLGPWRVGLPSARLALGQIGFSVLDIGFAAAAGWTLSAA